MTTDPPTTAPDDVVMGAVLGHTTVPERLHPAPSLWGFIGVHGGLTLALLIRAIQQRAGILRISSVSATFLKPLRGSFDISVDRHHAGRTVEFWRARAVVDGQPVVNAEAVLSAGTSDHTPIAPPAPSAPPPQDCAVLRVPRSLVPISTRTEIRPVGSNRPFASGPEPELTAWLRLTDDDECVDVARLAMLIDSLAPSYAAVLASPVPIPTVSLTLSPTPDLPKGNSPWILLRARTVAASADGWIDEHLDAWNLSRSYLGHGFQRRRIFDGAPRL